MSLTPKQQKKLAKVKELEDDSVLTVANDLVELEEKIESEVESLKEIVLQVEAQKGDVGERGEKGDTGEKGDKGDVGAKGDKGDKGDSGKDGKDGVNGKDGRDGKDGKNGVDGKNGKDGEPDKKTKKLVVTLEKDVKTIKDYDIPTLQNRTQLLNQMISGLSRDLESQDTLQEVTNNGSATTNDITVNSVTETVPTLLKLNQTTPQTFTAGTVTGTGLLKVTSGTLGLDTTTYLDTTTAATTYAKLDGTNHPFTYVITPKIYPSADSTTALQILKADGTTPVATFDTTNGRFGIGITPTSLFQVNVTDTSAGATDIVKYTTTSGGVMALNVSDKSVANPTWTFSSGTSEPFGFSLGGVTKMTVGTNSVTTTVPVLTSDGTAGAPAHSFSADTNNGMFRATTDTLGFSTAGTERIRIDSTGNVGIGTTTPAYKLDIVGSRINLKNSGTSQNTIFALFDSLDSNNSAYILFGVNSGSSTGFSGRQGSYLSTGKNGTGVAQDLILHNYADKSIIFATNNTQRAVIDGTGNVGIGVTPTELLELKDAGNIKFQTTTGTKIGTATDQKIGFWNATPVIQQVTNAYTSDGEGSAYTGIDNLQVGTPYAQVSDLNQLRVAYETLRSSYDDLLTKLKTTGVVA